MIPQALINQLISLICFIIYFTNYFSLNYIPRGYKRISANLIEISIELGLYYLIYDFVFYYLHLLLHTPNFYFIHKKHHSTFGTIGISNYYMSTLDFILEVIIPFILGPFIINCHAITFIIFLVISNLNSIIVHSGYQIPFLPQPDIHFIHHDQYNKNYSLHFPDRIHNTLDIEMRNYSKKIC